jgi:hypothetical protein
MTTDLNDHEKIAETEMETEIYSNSNSNSNWDICSENEYFGGFRFLSPKTKKEFVLNSLDKRVDSNIIDEAIIVVDGEDGFVVDEKQNPNIFGSGNFISSENKNENEKEKEKEKETDLKKATKNVFAKFKSYNSEGGSGRVNFAAPPKNNIPRNMFGSASSTAKQNKEKNASTSVSASGLGPGIEEITNHYSHQGKFLNFAFLQKVPKESVDKTAAFSYKQFKEKRNI